MVLKLLLDKVQYFTQWRRLLAGIEGVRLSFLKAQKKKLDILPRILLLAIHLVLLAAYKPA